jgi:tetratricopeptide (TPR) repeat protein
MSKYTRKKKKELAEDEFVSFWGRLFEKLKPYAKAITIILATAVVIVFAAWGISSYREGRAEAAAERFARAVAIYEAELLGESETPKSDENATPRYKTAKERADAALAALDKLDQEFGRSKVAEAALVFRAGILFDQGKHDEAALIYEKFLVSGLRDAALQAVAQEGAALCDEARGRLDDALAKWKVLEKPLVDGKVKGNDFYHDRALVGQARIWAKKGDAKRAQELYKAALKQVPDSALREDIETQLALLEAK